MFKPLLASPVDDLTKVKLPVLGSPKIDGFRAFGFIEGLLSRNMKHIPNQFTQERFSASEYHGLDGELIVGLPYGEGVFARTSSGVTNRTKLDVDVIYYVFDLPHMNAPFHERYAALKEKCKNLPHVVVLEQVLLSTIEELIAYEAEQVGLGYEGIMIRDPNGKYKQGRSSLKEGILLKVKRFEDSEAAIIGYEELMKNTNEATKDAFGRTKRSSHKDNMVPMGTLGAFKLRDLKTDVEFMSGSGLNEKPGDPLNRHDLWARLQRGEMMGDIWTYKYFPVGVKDKPRFPILKGPRSRIDF